MTDQFTPAAEPADSEGSLPDRDVQRGDTLRVRIEGMHCASCVARVEAALRPLPHVRDVSVNLATNEARLLVDGGAKPDVQSALEPLGYRATAVFDSATGAGESVTAAAHDRFQWREFATPVLLAAAVSVWASLVEANPFAPSVMLGLATIVLLGFGREFFANAAGAVRHARLDMDVLVALGAGAAYLAGLWSFVETLSHPASHRGELAGQCGSEFTAAVLIIVFVRAGRLLEARARRKASEAVSRLLSLQAPIAHVIRTTSDLLAQESEVDVPVDQVQTGDILLVRAGERVPVDGEVTAGETEIDESRFTGEPLPVHKQPGAPVFGGSVNQTGMFRFRATRVGDEMLLRRIAALVRDAQGSKAPIARLADRVAGVFVPIVLAIAAITLAWWWRHADAHTAIAHAVAVLVVACPCALGLATPTAVMVAMGKGAELGVLFKDGAALERSAALQIALFDKTGTLTEGRPEIVDVVLADGVSRDELLRTAAAIAAASTHPLSRAIVEFARRQGVVPASIPGDVTSRPGLGLVARIDGEPAALGNARLLSEHGWNVSASRSQENGRTPMFVARGDRWLGSLLAEDRLRPTAAEATRALRQLGIEPGLVSGDRLSSAQRIAHKLRISLVEAELLPSEKADVVRALQSQGRRVGMIGDGVNDAPALATADVGFAVGAGADIAIEAADVTLIGDDPRAVPQAIELARRTLRIIRQNLCFAFAYNVVSIPLASGLLSTFGAIILPPGFAAAAMSASSVLVVTNSLRLRRFQPSVIPGI
jgi:Cu+-exporting ATPase